MNQNSAADTIGQFRLDGKVSLVSGASRGIGRAMAEGLAGAGSDLVIAGREIDTLTPVAKQITEETGRNVLPIQADVGNLQDIDTLVDQTVTTFGRLDVLVNNAGVNVRNPALEFSEEDWDFVTDVNLKGAFFLAKACGKVMEKHGGGKVINTLSLTSAIGLPTSVAYTAAKGGIAAMTLTMARDLGTHGIRCMTIAPSLFDTGLTAGIPEAGATQLTKDAAFPKRMGQPHEYATMAIAIYECAMMNGSTMRVDAGQRFAPR